MYSSRKRQSAPAVAQESVETLRHRRLAVGRGRVAPGDVVDLGLFRHGNAVSAAPMVIQGRWVEYL